MNRFDPLVGNIITRILTNDNRTKLIFVDDLNKQHTFIAEHDCCNDVWFYQTSNIMDLIKDEVIKTEDREWIRRDDITDGQEVNETISFVLVCGKGYVDIEVRNSHNGYYGGTVNYTVTEYNLDDMVSKGNLFDVKSDDDF